MLEEEMDKLHAASPPVDEERLSRLGRLWRLARSATDSSVRKDLGAPVPSSQLPKDFADDQSPPANIVSDPACVKNILKEYKDFFKGANSRTQIERNPRLEMATADGLHKGWTPLLVRLGSDMLLGIKDKNICTIVNKVTIPPTAKVYHDNLLQLLIWDAGEDQFNIARIHWFSNPDAEIGRPYVDKYRKYQADFNGLGQIGDDPDDRTRPVIDKISSRSKGFAVKKQNMLFYQIQWVDSLEPTTNADAYFKTEPAAMKDFSVRNGGQQLLYKDQVIDEVQDSENAKFTSYAYQKTSENSGYLAYIAASKLSLDIQTLTILKFDKALLNKLAKDVKLEISRFTFQRPPISQIAFGEGKANEGWLFFKTGDGDYYRTLFGVKQMRQRLCEILKSYSNKNLVDENIATSAFQVLKENKDGFVYKIVKEIGGPCSDGGKPNQSGWLLGDKPSLQSGTASAK